MSQEPPKRKPGHGFADKFKKKTDGDAEGANSGGGRAGALRPAEKKAGGFAQRVDKASPKKEGFAGSIPKSAGNKNFTDKTNGRIVYFVKDSSQPAWFYMLVPKEKLPVLEYRLSLTEGETELTDYGEIVASGWGEEPPEDVVERIREEYGAA